MATRIPTLSSLDIHQTKIGFVNQGRRLQRLPGFSLAILAAANARNLS